MPDNDKHWRMVAFIVRCAQRYGTAYVKDEAEPAFSRTAVADALALAEASTIASPDSDQDSEVWMVGDAYFDNYDIEALICALSSADEAAQNTYADLHEDPSVERLTRHAWTAIRLAGLAVHTAMRAEPGSDIEDLVKQAVSWATDDEPELVNIIGADLIRAMTSDASTSEGLDAMFGDLWPEGHPEGW